MPLRRKIAAYLDRSEREAEERRQAAIDEEAERRRAEEILRRRREMERMMRAILPDWVFVAGTPDGVVPYAVEYERRAVTPALMKERLEPYKQYYDAMYRFEDLGTVLVTLFVFESVTHASGLASLCLSDSNIAQTWMGRRLPLYISSVEAIRQEGIWDDIWFDVNGEFAGQHVTLTDRRIGWDLEASRNRRVGYMWRRCGGRNGPK